MAVPTAFLPLQAENANLERYRNIDQQLAQQAADGRAVDRGVRLQARYAKYPWLSPGIATAYTKWEEQYGTHAAKGLAQTAYSAMQDGGTQKSLSKDLEQFVATKDFQAQVKNYYQNGGIESWFKATRDNREATPAEKKQATQAFLNQLNTSETSFGEAVDSVPAVGPALKGASRAVFTALESPYQELQAGASSLIGHVTNAFTDAAQTTGSGQGDAATKPNLAAGIPAPSASPLQVGDYHFGTSTGAIALQHLASGDNVDLGTGFFPGGEIAKEHTQQVRDIASLTYNGQRHFATPGRIFASAVTEPGTDPFNALSGLVDAATIIKADPANIALTKLGDVREARAGFSAASDLEQAGGFTSWVRHFVDPPTVDQYLASKEGAALKSTLAATGPENLAELGRRTNWKWSADTYAKVIAAETPEDVDAALRPALGLTIDRQPDLSSFAASARNVTQQIPALTEIPGTRLDISNAALGGQNGSLRALYNHGLGLGLSDEQISSHLNDIVQASGKVERSRGIMDYMEMEKSGLMARGLPEDQATRLTRFAQQDLAGNARTYFDQQIASGAHTPGVVLGGEAFPLDKPYLLSEHLGDQIYLTPLNGAGGRNQALAKYARILGTPGTGFNETRDEFGDLLPGIVPKVSAGLAKVRQAAWESNSFLTHMQNSLWKPFQLIRGAWAVRVLGEEQLRMAMAGYDNIYTHPISYISGLAARKEGDAGELLDFAAEQKALRGSQEGAFGLPSNDGYWRQIAKNTGTFHPGEGSFHDVWADKLARYSEDPVMSQVAKTVADGGSMEDLKQSFLRGQLSGFREDLSSDPNFASSGIDLTTKEGADAYIDGLYDRLHYYTNGDGDLISTIANQKYKPDLEAVARKSSLKGETLSYDGDPVEVVAHRKGSPNVKVQLPDGNVEDIAVSMLDVPDAGGAKLLTKNNSGTMLDKGFVRHLESMGDEIKPAQVSGTHVVWDKAKSSQADALVNWAFANLMDKPTSYLNRSTVFLEEHQNEMDRLAPFIQSGEITADEADTIAKSKGVDTLRDLLYDTHKANRGLKALQVVFPFGEAWKEMFGSWARIVAKEPQTIRKFQVGITAATQANPFALIPGAVPDTYADKGFFYKDPNNEGREMFVYPWSAAMNDNLIGVPVPFTGEAQSLNIGFNLFPGVGPVFQAPAMFFLNRYMDDKKWDPIRHLIAPYGETDADSGWIENTLLPAWARKLVIGLTASPSSNTQSARALNSTIGDIMSYWQSTGQMDPHNGDPGYVQSQYEKAEKAARWLYVIRGSLQSVAPAAPGPDFLAETKNKNLTQFWVLSKALRKLYQDDPDNATAKFIDRFGENAIYATAPKTLGASFGNEYSPEAWDWQRSNKNIVSKYPLAWPEFVPRNDSGEFSSDAYQQAISRGDTTAIPAKERTKRTNNVLGAMWYDQVREKMGLKRGEVGTEPQRLHLADVRNQIHQEYPGWREVLTDDTRVPRAVEELVNASKDPAVKKANPRIAEALAAYVKARTYVIGEVKAQGGGGDFTRPGFASGNKWQPYRTYLRNVADEITKQAPQFGPLFEDVFDREMSEDN